MATPDNAPNADSGSKGRWEKLEIVSRIFATIGIPVVLGFGTWWIQATISQQSVSKDYVKLALSILEKKRDNTEAQTSKGLRKWAVELLNKTSPVELDNFTVDELMKGTLQLPLSSARVGAATDLFDTLKSGQISEEVTSPDKKVAAKYYDSGVLSGRDLQSKGSWEILTPIHRPTGLVFSSLVSGDHYLMVMFNSMMFELVEITPQTRTPFSFISAVSDIRDPNQLPCGGSPQLGSLTTENS
jgi:hypothetical protein